MKWMRRGTLLGHDWYIRIGKRVTVEGINSQLADGNSALFWEFDGVGFDDVRNALKVAQTTFGLPPIHILKASEGESYHAVCLVKYTWLDALGAVAMTPHVDPDYVRLAAQRGHFTLRLTDKGQGEPYVCDTLPSFIPPSANIDDFVQAVRYGAWQR